MRDLMSLAALLCGVAILALVGCVDPGVGPDGTNPNGECELVENVCLPAGALVARISTNVQADVEIENAYVLEDEVSWVLRESQPEDGPSSIQAQADGFGHPPCDVWVEDGLATVEIRHAAGWAEAFDQEQVETFDLESGDALEIRLTELWFDDKTLTCYVDGDSSPAWSGMVASSSGETVNGFWDGHLFHHDGTFHFSDNNSRIDLVANEDRSWLYGELENPFYGLVTLDCAVE